jgi:hypothetical protein
MITMKIQVWKRRHIHKLYEAVACSGPKSWYGSMRSWCSKCLKVYAGVKQSFSSVSIGLKFVIKCWFLNIKINLNFVIFRNPNEPNVLNIKTGVVGAEAVCEVQYVRTKWNRECRNLCIHSSKQCCGVVSFSWSRSQDQSRICLRLR